MKTESHEIKTQFMELYEAYNDEIFRFSLAKTRNRDLSLDITQETFIKTWDYLRTGKNIDKSRAFLYRICRNLIIDHSRKKKFASLDALLEASHTHDPVDDAPIPTGNQIDNDALMQQLQNLDEHHFEILHLRFIQELTLSEIAAIYKESENTISVKIHRAIKHAQKLLRPTNEPFYET